MIQSKSASPLGNNWYSYVNGDPVNNNDPSGYRSAFQRITDPFRPEPGSAGSDSSKPCGGKNDALDKCLKRALELYDKGKRWCATQFSPYYKPLEYWSCIATQGVVLWYREEYCRATHGRK